MNAYCAHSVLKINETALARNFNIIQAIAPQSKILAMIKANAYGHGLVRTAKVLSEAAGFGVACLDEAVQLRKAGITQKIVVMRGVFNQTELALANQLKVDLVIHCFLQFELLSKQTHWLKINTGMNRLGFSQDELPQVWEKLKNISPADIILFTHFSSAEELSPVVTLSQIQQFEEITQGLKQEKSLANSAGILNFKESHQSWIRPGLLLYGVSPLENKTGSDFDLDPVMTWQSQLIAVRMQKKGDRVGYNGRYICEENMPIGIVGAGYADGYPRHAKNGTPVLVNGSEVSLTGRVSMDMLAVDLRKAPQAKTGDRVILWGEGLPVEKVAGYTASNVYELLCNARSRSPAD
jgi:alanine racemase